MKVKSNYVDKKDVTFCSITDSVGAVLQLLEKSKYRCIPVLSNNGIIYEGNIYKVNLLESIIKGELDSDSPITSLIMEKETSIGEESSFVKAFYSIKRYPYLAVLAPEGEFAGILTHAKVFEVLEDSWGFKDGGRVMTLVTSENQGALQRLLKEIGKHTIIDSVMTMDQGNRLFRRIIVTLPSDIDEARYQQIKKDLERKGIKILFEDVISK